MENHALPSLSLSPRLGIRGMALWLGGREEVRSVTQGERQVSYPHVKMMICYVYLHVNLAPPTLGMQDC